MAIHWIDMAIIVAYLLGITGVGIWFSRRQRESSASYFLAGRSLGWVTVGLALFATNISTVHLTGLAGAGFREGMVFGNFEWLGSFLLILLSLVFAPFYFRTRIATLPEYLEGRYGPASRTVLACMAVAGALFIHIGVTIYAGAEVLKTIIRFDTPSWWLPLAEHLDYNIALSIGVVSLLTISYTALGGLKAVVVTESIQTVLLLLGAAAVTVFGLAELQRRGTVSLADVHRACLVQEALDSAEQAKGLQRAGEECAEMGKPPDLEAGDSHAGLHAAESGFLEVASTEPRSRRLSMIHTRGDYTWWIMLLGYPVLGVWYWCADQTIVQRVLAARSEWDAQVGPLFAGFIKVLPVFLMVFPGILAYLLFRDKIGENADATLSVLILELLPRGMQGLVLAGLLAAMMSTVAGALNSTATLVSIDIVKRIRPATSDRTLVRIGQVTAVLVMIAAMAWSTQGSRFGGIFAGINQMIAVLAPPISTVFVWGIFWPRGTSAAAFTTLLSGSVLGLIVFVADFPAFGIEWITKGWGVPFMLQAWILFVVCSAIFVAISLLTRPPERACVDQYCWSRPLAAITEARFIGISDPRTLALMLIALIAACYFVFA